MKKDELLTVEEAAGWLTISKPTLWRLIRSGEIPVVKIARRTIRLKLTDLENYVERNYGNITEIRGFQKEAKK
jgi:excisionase family DNA binding protein